MYHAYLECTSRWFDLQYQLCARRKRRARRPPRRLRSRHIRYHPSARACAEQCAALRIVRHDEARTSISAHFGSCGCSGAQSTDAHIRESASNQNGGSAGSASYPAAASLTTMICPTIRTLTASRTSGRA